MDYRELAVEFMKTSHSMHKGRGQKKISDSMQGESFVLYYIANNENATPSDISNEMNISSARIAATLKSLENKGLIIRRIDVEDRRRILIDLTEKGKIQVEQHNEMIMNTITNMLKFLGEEDAKEFLRILKKLSTKVPEDFE